MALSDPAKNLWPGGHIIEDGDASASITSKVVDISGATHCGVQLYSAAAGTRAGTVAIQESIDGENWVAITFADDTTSITVTASTLLNELKNLAGLGGLYLRVVYTSSSGTGTLQCYATRKFSAKG